MTRRLRVALVSIGLGRFQRGFERLFADLADVMREEVDVTLFAGAPGPGRLVPPGLKALTRLAHHVPVGRVETEYREYKQDCLAYALALCPALMRGGFDVVHLIDPPLSKLVEQMLVLLPRTTRLLYTNGTAWPIALCPRRARIHHVQQGSYQEALDAGDSRLRNVLLPCGIHAKRFEATDERTELRARHGVCEGTFVVLVVAAVKRVHKRVDHVINEVAALGGDVLLWIDGKPEDPDVVALANERLGARCRITYVSSDEVRLLYRIADVMVHAALEEAFGLTVVEALSTGLPVLVHDSAHFEWLVGDREPLIDMRQPGALRERLAFAMDARAGRTDRDLRRAESVRSRFDWPQLRAQYLAMYNGSAG